MLTTAYSLFWEAIILLRVYESWTRKDEERYHFIVSFLDSRARYAPTTFEHKVLFLQGATLDGPLLSPLADIRSRQHSPIEEYDLMENAIKRAKAVGMLQVAISKLISHYRMPPFSLSVLQSFTLDKAGKGSQMHICLKPLRCGTECLSI